MRDGAKVGSAALAFAGIALVFVFQALTPSLPQVGLDASWVAAMGEAADCGLRWGIDVDFTYGPASPLVTGYLNTAWATRTLPLAVGFSALFGWCTALLVAAHRPVSRAAAGTAACGLMLAAARGTPDAFFLGLPLLVLLLAVRREPGGGRAAAMLAGAFALGLTAMAKMSYPLAALPVLALADGLLLLRRRGLPVLLALFALGILSGALLYGQRFADLPAYALMQGEVVRGYAAGMALDGPLWDLLPFAVLAAGLLVAVAAAGRRSAEGRAVAAGLAVVLLVLFKAGFIRHDLHSLIAWTGLSLVGTVTAWSRLPTRSALAVTAAACFVVLVYEPVMTVRQSVRVGRGEALVRLYRDWLVDGPRLQAEALGAAWRDPAGFRADLDDAKAQAWRDIAADRPLPRLPGGVDILPSDQTRVMAAGLDYRQRPSFQEYSTYTPALAAANRAFVEGPRAPRWILFGPDRPLGALALDERFPSLAEGPLWSDLLGRYRPERRIGSLVALERRAVPAPVSFGPERAASIGFGAILPVAGEGPLWATVDVGVDLAGSVVSALFRPPLLSLHVWLDDGTDRRFRLIPALAAAGFLLTPLVENAADYVSLAAGRPPGPGRRVTALAVEGSRAARMLYRSGIAVTLRSLDVAPGGRAPGDAEPGGSLDGGGPALEGAGLASLPLSALPVADGRRRVTLDYGRASGAGGPEVCMAAHRADGTRSTLWQGCLGNDSAGPDRASVVLDVPDSVEELALEIRCAGGTCPGAWIGTAPSGSAARDSTAAR